MHALIWNVGMTADPRSCRFAILRSFFTRPTRGVYPLGGRFREQRSHLSHGRQAYERLNAQTFHLILKMSSLVCFGWRLARNGGPQFYMHSRTTAYLDIYPRDSTVKTRDGETLSLFLPLPRGRHGKCRLHSVQQFSNQSACWS